MPAKKQKRRGRRPPSKKNPDERLRNVYYQYGSRGALQNNPKKLQEIVNNSRQKLPPISREKVEEFLSKQPSYTVHRRVRKRQFPRRKILVPTPKLRIDGDLLELRDLSPWNSGYNYSLILIDAFTRFTWSRALKNKESKTVADAFEELHATDPEALTPLYLYTDAGREFVGAAFQSALKKRGIDHRIGSSEDFHCPFVERVIRTLKEKLFQAMTAQHTRRWIDLLPHVVNTYNQTEHSALGMEPGEARQPENFLKALKKTYPIKGVGDKSRKPPPKYRFKRGELVRIQKAKGGRLGSKGYLPNFSWEIFRIRGRANTKPHDKLRGPPAYILEDLEGELIENAVFYEAELVRVHPDQLSGPMPVREILEQKGDQVLVWFQGYAKKDAMWISRKQIV